MDETPFAPREVRLRSSSSQMFLPDLDVTAFADSGFRATKMFTLMSSQEIMVASSEPNCFGSAMRLTVVVCGWGEEPKGARPSEIGDRRNG